MPRIETQYIQSDTLDNNRAFIMEPFRKEGNVVSFRENNPDFATPRKATMTIGWAEPTKNSKVAKARLKISVPMWVPNFVDDEVGKIVGSVSFDGVFFLPADASVEQRELIVELVRSALIEHATQPRALRNVVKTATPLF